MISSLFVQISSSCVVSLFRDVFMFSIGGGKQGGMLGVGRIGFHPSCVTKTSLVAATPPPRPWSPAPPDAPSFSSVGPRACAFPANAKPHVLLCVLHAALHNIPSLSCNFSIPVKRPR